MERDYSVIGACSCWGAQIRSCETGPEELIQGGLFEELQRDGISIREVEAIYPTIRAKEQDIPLSQSLPLIKKFNLQLTSKVKEIVKNGAFPIVLGGDHSIAIGTWSAFAQPFGLLWIDAHMDSHNLKTTPSGAFHGMPLAALLGHAPEIIDRKGAVLKPENVALIGIRSFEEGEEALLKKLNVRIYFMDEVKKRGLQEIIPEAISHVTRGARHYGVSLDLDVFTPAEVPGVGSRAQGGIATQEFIPLLSHFAKDQRFMAFEMVEFNPTLDDHHKTKKIAYQILKEVMR